MQEVNTLQWKGHAHKNNEYLVIQLSVLFLIISELKPSFKEIRDGAYNPRDHWSESPSLIEGTG